ncbi:hypothetical protein PybrP1_008124 [[Pythium] brassicae (nom. inval.)]|nr:hypothetical protein PybrP1_008124 [[Pythium] brassicae (nom. inval.)]
MAMELSGARVALRKSIDLAMLPDARGSALAPPLAARSHSAPEVSAFKKPSAQQSSRTVDVVSLGIAALHTTKPPPAPPATPPPAKSSSPTLCTVGAPAAWSPRELFAAVADDTFFGFLEAFNLQLSDGAGDAATRGATAIPINAYADQHGKTLLHHACRLGKLHVATALLFHGVDVLARCHIGRTAFHDAISCGDAPTALALVQLLFAHEPRGLSIVDTNGSHIVHLAAIHGCLDVLQWYAALLLAKREREHDDNGSGDTVGRCRDAAPAVALAPLSITSFSGRNLLHYAAYNGRLRVLQWALSSANRWSLAFSAAALDANGYSLLHYAAMGGHLELCEWLVNHSSTRSDLHILAKNSAGQTAFDLAKTPEVKLFVAQASQLPPTPVNVRCVGADASSLGVAWDVALHADLLLRDVLAPLAFELEYCKKPKGLSGASGLLSMVLLMPASASPYLLRWEQLRVRMAPSAREFWLAGLERDTEYLVRVRAVNRNGCSAFTAPNLSVSEFQTTGAGSGLRRILGLFPRSSSSSAAAPTFIGTLHLELLEARHLRVAVGGGDDDDGREHARAQSADHGHVYCQLTVSLSDVALATTPPSRRRTVPLVAAALRKMGSARTKTLYCVRSERARIQEEMVLAGSSHALQHPAFDVSVRFRVPEAADAMLTVEVRHRTHRVDAVIGVLRIPLIDFVRGLPAKLQWLSLESASSRAFVLPPSSPVPPSSAASSKAPQDDADPVCGEILLRALFLADGITELPHPTCGDRMSSSAQELLAAYPEAGGSSSSTKRDAEAAGTGRGGGDRFDAMGFRVFDPREPLGGGVGPTRGLSKSYEYYKLLQECVDRRQTQRWEAFHHDAHASSSDAAPRSRRSLSSRQSRHSSSSSDVPGSSGGGACACAFSAPDVSCCPYDARTSSALRRLVWDGVPSAWRPAIYVRLSGALRERARYPPQYFQSLLQRTAAARAESPTRAARKVDETRRDSSERRAFEAAERQIQVDLQRTFAGNACWINSAAGQRALERVLLAYAVHNHALGYCQSMTFIVGRLLCLFQFHTGGTATTTDATDAGDATDAVAADELAFWMLAVFCEKFFPAYYTKGMAGLQVDGLVLESLMRQRLPKVHRHLQQLQTPHMGLLLVTQWLLPVCCAVFPSETSFRLLDVLLAEGSRAVFALAIALLRVSQHELLAETNDYMQLFRFLKDRDLRLYDTALLLELARDEHAVVQHEIDALRRRFARDVDSGADSNDGSGGDSNDDSNDDPGGDSENDDDEDAVDGIDSVGDLAEEEMNARA